MKYTLVSVGDSLTQGFQSFAVCNNGQEFSFPNQIVKYNKDLFTPFKIPYIEYPGFPLNLESFLNELEEMIQCGIDPLTKLEIFYDIIKGVFAGKTARTGRNNNLGIYGYTAEDVLKANFKDGTGFLQRMLLILGEKRSIFKKIATLLTGFKEKPKGQKFIADEGNDKFSSFNFAKITYYVLCGAKKDMSKSQIQIAYETCAEAEKEGRECLVTYWAGNNDIIGAILSGDSSYISNVNDVLSHIRLSIEKLLSIGNTRIVFSTIPELDDIPFVDKKTFEPIFPVYETLSKEVYTKIDSAIKELNNGIRQLYGSLGKYDNRICLIEMDKFFNNICSKGYEVVLKDGLTLNLTADFISLSEDKKLEKGGLFSLDGVHPTSTGYALIANEFIKGFRKLGIYLNEVDVNETAGADTLINTPPAIIPEFLDVNSYAREIADKMGVLWIIRNICLEQFNMKMK